MEGTWLCYRGGHFNGRRMVMLQVTLMEEEWSCYGGGQFIEGEWSFYRGAHFKGHVMEVATKGGRMVILWRLLL